MSDLINGLPNIFGQEKDFLNSKKDRSQLYSKISTVDINNVTASWGIALHMHQPTIPAGSDDLRSASLVSNLQHMMEHQGIGDNHNAGVFYDCYRRMSRLITSHVAAGHNPRIMLDYSGNLLWGLRQMGGGEVLEELKLITTDAKYHPYVEWLGTMWSHAVASSTPVPDLKLHIMAWKNHFASIFGKEALNRVKGFSPPEMHLPIHPDVCYEYIRALKECGYAWMMVQEHTIENLDGSGISRPHFPHKLVARNSMGETEEITILIKTQGSDTKLVAQMQPYHEAMSIGRQEYAGKEIPPFVCQIGDGENGGVMMNEFPPMYDQTFNGIGTSGTVALNGSEYLELLLAQGLKEDDFIPVQPISQHRIWAKITKSGPKSVDNAIDAIHAEDSNFNLDKGSWTSDRSWISGYESVLDPMNNLSVAFHNKMDNDKSPLNYHEALLYLLLSQTSCFRYWGEGMWTEYAKELCRRGMAALEK